MSRSVWGMLAVVIAATGMGLGWLIWSGTGARPAPKPEPVVFVCRESGEVFTGTPRPTPAVHPQTGQATLMPGLYDPVKQVWVTGPPLEVQQRAASKPNAAPGKSRLLREGPLPENATPL